MLVKAGRPVFRANEQFTPDQLLARTARSAVGQLADGRLLLVTVDGAQPGYSAGVTNFELALELVKLGAVTAAALDGGGSATMAFDGRLLSKPSGPGARRSATRCSSSMRGVYAPPPLEPVLSPNGDGVAERQRLAYKLVRPSNVNAALLGPDGVARFSFSGSQAAGTYPLDWPGVRADGTPELEGRWRWMVTATDDTGAASTAERAFQLNRTLGFAAPVVPAACRSAPAAARGRDLQARPRGDGHAPDRDRLGRPHPRRCRRSARAAGDLQVAWDGRTDGGRCRLLGELRRRGDGDERARLGDAGRDLPGAAEVTSDSVVLASVTHTITSYVNDHGIYAVFVLMVIDAVFPAASELVMIYAGALAAARSPAATWSCSAPGRLALLGVHRVVARRHARLPRRLARSAGGSASAAGGRCSSGTARWFHLSPGEARRRRRPGSSGAATSPSSSAGSRRVVRSFISIPAGVFRMPLGRYTLLTLVGSAIWCFALRRRSAGVSEELPARPRGLPLCGLRCGRRRVVSLAAWCRVPTTS